MKLIHTGEGLMMQGQGPTELRLAFRRYLCHGNAVGMSSRQGDDAPAHIHSVKMPIR